MPVHTAGIRTESDCVAVRGRTAHPRTERVSGGKPQL